MAIMSFEEFWNNWNIFKLNFGQKFIGELSYSGFTKMWTGGDLNP